MHLTPKILLIHLADPHSRLVTHVCTSPIFKKLRKITQIFSESSDHHLWDCGSGRGDHWWHLCCPKIMLLQSSIPEWKTLINVDTLPRKLWMFFVIFFSWDMFIILNRIFWHLLKRYIISLKLIYKLLGLSMHTNN